MTIVRVKASRTTKDFKGITWIHAVLRWEWDLHYAAGQSGEGVVQDLIETIVISYSQSICTHIESYCKCYKTMVQDVQLREEYFDG